MEEWTPTAVALILTTIGVTIDKVITSYFTGRKLAMIEAHVNSQKTADASKIQALENEARLLREQAAENTRIAAVLAQSQTTIMSQIRAQIPAQIREEPKVLEEIKDNTANTVNAVKDLKKGKI